MAEGTRAARRISCGQCTAWGRPLASQFESKFMTKDKRLKGALWGSKAKQKQEVASPGIFRAKPGKRVQIQGGKETIFWEPWDAGEWIPAGPAARTCV